MNEGKGKGRVRGQVQGGLREGWEWGLEGANETRKRRPSSPLVSRRWAAPRDPELGIRPLGFSGASCRLGGVWWRWGFGLTSSGGLFLQPEPAMCLRSGTRVGFFHSALGLTFVSAS
jgi:hypothetical protein